MQLEASETLLMTDCLGVGEPSREKAAEFTSLLIERAKEGDAAALEQIMIRYEQRVLATAWRMLGNEADARDAAQEAFLRVHKYLKSFRAGEDFTGWLYRIVINACRDARRRNFRNRQFVSLEAELEAGSCDALRSADDHEAAAIRSQQQALIRAALDTLSDKERAAIVLRDLEGLATEDVARILGSSAATVRSQISSGRAKIKLYRDRVLKATKRGLA
jgi:RNA polymerase sigma-70 factor (ECF subfamily)